MPHLQVAPTTNDKVATKDAETKRKTKGSVESKGDKGVDSLLALAATAREHANGGLENVSGKRHLEDAALASFGGAYAPVTPSPYGRGLSFRVHPPHPMHQQRTMMYPEGPAGVGPPSYGAKKLFASPIRVAAARNQEGERDKKKENDVSSPDRVGGEKEDKATPEEKRRKNEMGRTSGADGRVHQEPGQRPQEQPYPLRSSPYHSQYQMVYQGMPPYPGYLNIAYPYVDHLGQPQVGHGKNPSRTPPAGEKNSYGFSPMKSRSPSEKDKDKRNDSPEGRPATGSVGESDEDMPAQNTESEKDMSPEKNKPQTKSKRVISPSSSLEASQASMKGDDDESVGGKPRDPPPYPSQGAPRGGPRYPPFYPPDPRYGYPPHVHEGFPAHGWHNYSAYPMHYAGMMHTPAGYMHPGQQQPYPMGPPAPGGHYPPYPYPQAKKPRLSAPSSSENKGVPDSAPSATRSLEKKENGGMDRAGASEETKIKSVAEWQRATMATGLAPSTNRCVPLKGPIPSKYWGEAEKAKNVTTPDFHHLVNYPDYMAKNASTPSGMVFSQDGKKHCVMCGKERLSSAGAMMSRSRSSAKSRQDEGGGDDAPIHIIPRQNKGLCTECDVRVWIICATGLEIKWCKGCKNFRPWAAFGDKGLATKCARCRDRQREKYAMQKDELKKQRNRRANNGDADEKKNGSTKNSSSEYAYAEEKKVGDDMDHQQEIVAARGLSNLIAATVEMDHQVQN